MKFTDVFIKRPVLATVISLLIFLIGARAFVQLDVRQYPEIKNTVIKISTQYPGADSKLVKGFITAPLQEAVAEASNIEYITSSSTQGLSVIEAHLKLNTEPGAAIAEVQAKVASKRNVLPDNAENPVIESTTGSATALMYIAFYSNDLSRPQITDYIQRVVQPQLQALPGVAKARIIGQPLAMRVWLDPKRMTALGVTAEDIAQSLRKNNFQVGVGAIKGKYVALDLTASTQLSNARDFSKLVVLSKDKTLVRLGDVAQVKLGAENYKTSAWYSGIPAVFIGVEPAPEANPLTVANLVNQEVPVIRKQLPEGVKVKVPYDASEFIQASIDEVYTTLIEAMIIVLVVIYVTLGSLRAAIVPAIAVPLSMVGAGFIMYAFGYSINLLTLLAMILSIGLVVDDAIIVVENVHRHIEAGKRPHDAALAGARELALPIIAMTTTLLAVFAPIGFEGGLLGALFSEFVFTLAAAVLISGIVALTLSPMLSARVLKSRRESGRFEQWVEQKFESLSATYRRLLQSGLQTRSVFIFVGVVVFISNFFMWASSKQEVAPTEDQSILFFAAASPQTATLDYHKHYAKQIHDIFKQFPEYKESFFILARAADTTFGGFKMKSPEKRQRSQMQVMFPLMGALTQVPGFKVGMFPAPSIPTPSRGFPVQFVLMSSRDHKDINKYANQLIGSSMKSGHFVFLKKSVDINRPTVRIQIDRNRAGDLGINMEDIGKVLSRMLGGGYVNWFTMSGRSYKVIPQVAQNFRVNESLLEDYHIRAANGQLIPLSNLVKLHRSVEPSARTQFQQLNSITIEGLLMPGTDIGTALGVLEKQANAILPKDYQYDFTGESRQFAAQGHSFIVTFIMSLLVIYLVLAAQFESWRDPLIILVSVPMATAGALIFITLGASTINIYTQVGLITLIGVIAKNGILIVEFANKLRDSKNMSKLEAIVEASAIRLRPIIMTSVSLILAMVPLLIATGPGAISRFDIGLTIAAGLGIGTLFTLFVLPAFYLVIARR